MHKAILSLLLLFWFSLAQQASTSIKQQKQLSTTVYFTGGVPRCSSCGAGGEYACSTPIGNWNGGTQTFKDPFISSFNGSAVVTGVTAVVYGSWSCSSGSEVILQLSVAGNIIDIRSVVDVQQCSCGTCSPPATFTNNMFSGGLSGYEIGGTNALNIALFNGNSICVNRVELTFTYEVPMSKIAVAALEFQQRQHFAGCAVCNKPEHYNCGNWGLGSTFKDPLPPNSVLLAVSARIYGVFGGWGLPSVATLTLQGKALGDFGLNLTRSASGNPPCDICDGGVDFHSEFFFQTGWPNYNYGGMNSFAMNIDQWGWGCISVGQLFMEYYSA